MSKKNINHDHFEFIYRAVCNDCEDYVGSKRKSKEEAEVDKKAHLSIPKNKDHDVKIEVTQRFHI